MIQPKTVLVVHIRNRHTPFGQASPVLKLKNPLRHVCGASSCTKVRKKASLTVIENNDVMQHPYAFLPALGRNVSD